MSRVWLFASVPFLVLLVVGCEGLGWFSRGSSTALVPESPFGDPVPQAPQARPAFSPGPVSTAAAARVDTMGRKILADNPQIGAKPIFSTIGGPQPALFHRGTSEILITEGLVKQCATDGQLAALLCHELGAMVSEREALAGPIRNADPGPPMEVRVGTDSGGPSGSPDQTRLAELGKYEREHRRPTAPAVLPPDPDMLARSYLIQAKFSANELDAVTPLLQAAARNGGLERQMKAAPFTPNLALPSVNSPAPVVPRQ